MTLNPFRLYRQWKIRRRLRQFARFHEWDEFRSEAGGWR
jgi:hypothetical protein